MTTTQHDAQVDDAPIGSLIWHCSEEDSGPDVGVSIKLADDEILWLGEITCKLHQDSGCGSLGDDTGWWIIHYRGDDSRPIAKCCDEVAARDLFERLSGALSATCAKNAPVAALSTAAVPPQVTDAGEVERLIETADYYMQQLEAVQRRTRVVDLAEAKGAYLAARAALATQERG